MSWRIIDGPDVDDRHPDVTRFIYLLESAEGDRRHIVAPVSKSVFSMDPIPERLQQAIDTKGRSEVEAVLGEPDPPHELPIRHSRPAL